MSAILSDITSKFSISGLKDKFKDVYTNVNEKIVKVQEALLDKPEEKKDEKKEEKKEGKPEEKKEAYEEPPALKSTKDKIYDFLIKVKDYSISAALILIQIIFYVGLASLVANDMIIYSPVIRAVFFVFTLFVTRLFPPYAFFLTCYYALKKGYDYYHQNLSSEPVKPPKSFPMIFAILPLTTMYPTSQIVRFFLWAFMYQKTNKPERLKKENERLEEIMENYWVDLNKSFDYLEKIKSTEPFARLYEINKEHLTKEYMHPIVKHESNDAPPLPPTIQKNTSTEKERAEDLKAVTTAISEVAQAK